MAKSHFFLKQIEGHSPIKSKVILSKSRDAYTAIYSNPNTKNTLSYWCKDSHHDKPQTVILGL